MVPKYGIRHGVCSCDQHSNGTTTEDEDAKYREQMGAFLYACAIIGLYILITTTLLVRHTLRTTTSAYGRITDYQYVNNMCRSYRDVRWPRAWESQEYRSALKKQLCVHLIKMGQIATRVTNHNETEPETWTEKRARKESSTQTDMSTLLSRSRSAPLGRAFGREMSKRSRSMRDATNEENQALLTEQHLDLGI